MEAARLTNGTELCWWLTQGWNQQG